jgi:Undecaprenyl-phosphate galactose phosphotransferase WbaP
MRLVYLASDLAAFGASLSLAEIAVDLWTGRVLTLRSLDDWKIYFLWTVGLVAAAAAQQTYAPIPPRPVRKFRGWVVGASLVCIAIISIALILGAGSPVRKLTLTLATALAILLASFCRALCRIVFGSASWWGTRLIVVGSGAHAARAVLDMDREPQWGLRPVGFVGDRPTNGSLAAADHYLGSLDKLAPLADQYGVDWALVAANSFADDSLADLVLGTSSRIKHWIILPPLEQFPSMWLEACEAARRPALTVTNRLSLGWSTPVKRAFDLLVTSVLGLLALPIIGLIVLLIRLGSPGPIFYGQERIGRYGRRFKAWKFRTMLPNADAVLAEYLAAHPDLAAEWKANHKLKDDPRVTWIGNWLRRMSLDELPQVWNVLVGEMSLVGPRPIVAAEIEKYGRRYECYVKVVPGITGLWQVSGRNNTTYDERVALDVYYVQNWSLWLDVYIMACTAKVVLLREGAY